MLRVSAAAVVLALSVATGAHGCERYEVCGVAGCHSLVVVCDRDSFLLPNFAARSETLGEKGAAEKPVGTVVGAAIAEESKRGDKNHWPPDEQLEPNEPRPTSEPPLGLKNDLAIPSFTKGTGRILQIAILCVLASIVSAFIFKEVNMGICTNP